MMKLAKNFFPLLITVFFCWPASAQDPVTHILITNVNVWDGTSDNVKKADVLIEDEKITQVEANIKAPGGATIIDGKGGTLIPGLIDMHSHIGVRDGLDQGVARTDAFGIGALAADNSIRYLNQGFTTARDCGSPTEAVSRLIKDGSISGPRIYTSGAWITQTSGHADLGPWNDTRHSVDRFEDAEGVLVADGKAEVLKAARRNLRKGATQIKVMAGGGVSSQWDPIQVTEYSEEEIKTIVGAAEDWGTYVTVHAYHDRSVNRAIDAGARCIEHAFLVSEPTVKRMAEEGITLSLQGYMSYTVFAHPEEITFFTDDQKKKASQVHEGVENLTKWARKYNVFTVTGGDMFGMPYVDMQAENIIVEVESLGYSSLEALKHSTSNAAVLLQGEDWTGGLDPYSEGKLGVIEAGAWADLIVINGNPLEDITVLRDYKNNMRLIMKDGEVWKNILDE